MSESKSVHFTFAGHPSHGQLGRSDRGVHRAPLVVLSGRGEDEVK
jgi:hypothetical protein